MQAQEQKIEAGPFVEFGSEAAKQAYLRAYAPKGIESLDMWERACVECGLIPPPTVEDFRAGVDQYPQLKEWRARHLHQQVMGVLAAAFAPPKKPPVWKRFINLLLGRKPAEHAGVSMTIKRVTAEEMQDLLREIEEPCDCPRCAKVGEAKQAADGSVQP